MLLRQDWDLRFNHLTYDLKGDKNNQRWKELKMDMINDNTIRSG